jgi:imidazolonepropionase-like amidohydrolase
MRRFNANFLILFWGIFGGTSVFAIDEEIFPFPGKKSVGPAFHALVGGDIQINPQKRIQNATLLIHNGLIEKVGENIEVPTYYREWNCSGKSIYPGFIDPYLLFGKDDPTLLDLGHQNTILAKADLSFTGLPESSSAEIDSSFGKIGVNPEINIINILREKKPQWKDFRKRGFTTAHLAPSDGIFRGTGPCILLENGFSDQTILKEQVAQTIAFDPVGRNHNPSVYPNSLMGVLSAIRQIYLDVEFTKSLLKFHQKQPPLTPYRVHSGMRNLLKTIEPADSISTWFEPGSALMAAKAIELAKEFNLKRTAIVMTGDEWRRPDLAISPDHDYILPLHFPSIPSLPTHEDWQQISLDQLRSWDHAPSLAKLAFSKTKSLSFTTSDCDLPEFHQNLLKAMARGLSEENAIAALTLNPARLCGISEFSGSLEPGKLANFFIIDGPSYFTENPKFHSTWIRGKPEIHDRTKTDGENNQSTVKLQKTERTANFPSQSRNFIEAPSSILLKNFNLWTCEKEGILKNHDLIVKKGKIFAIGKNLNPNFPKKTKVINGNGKHLTPGIIDCHSHAMILGGVNESTLPSTAMVRIQDVINSESINIERQLAGGVTACNLLHGSANPIGGQNAVIKLRLGASPQELLFQNAPQGIKFALGENVKQSNWGDKYKTRFPQSRMGVKTFFENRFNAALAYGKSLNSAKQLNIPFKKNLELEAILEIIHGRRLIHCHSYRQDEIIVFLRTMESFGVRVGSMQHVLEGYKVADEIAKHGAGASTFSDWWAYKFEVYDAIPYAGALMHERGCVVSFNSDSPDHARRLNLEAAKAVKYGKLSEHEALKFVTLNPAKQLGIDNRVGSLKVGKDADFAIWTTNPLDYRSVCEQTWIDGKLFHDLKHSRKRNESLVHEREELVEKAKTKKKTSPVSKASKSAKEKFFKSSLEVACDLYPHSCRTNDCLTHSN